MQGLSHSSPLVLPSQEEERRLRTRAIIKVSSAERRQRTHATKDGQEKIEETGLKKDWSRIDGGVEELCLRLKCKRPNKFMKVHLVAKMFLEDGEEIEAVSKDTIRMNERESVWHITEDEENEKSVAQTIHVKMADILTEIHHILFSIQASSLEKSLSNIGEGKVILESSGVTCNSKCLWDFHSRSVEGNEAWIMVMTKTNDQWYYRQLVMSANHSLIESILTDSVDLVPLPPESIIPDDNDHLLVRVIEGRELLAKDNKPTKRNTSDPYYVLQFRDKKFRSSTCNRTLKPKWNEEYFDMGVLSMDEAEMLRIDIYDQDTMTPDDFMGCALIPKSELCRDAEENNEHVYDLSTSKNGIVSDDRSKAGIIRLEIIRSSCFEASSPSETSSDNSLS